MDIRYNVVNMRRDPSGIVKSIDLEMYLHGGGPHLTKLLKIDLGDPSGSPVPFESITEADIKSWLMYNKDGMDKMVKASQEIQEESQLIDGLPWSS